MPFFHVFLSFFQSTFQGAPCATSTLLCSCSTRSFPKNSVHFIYFLKNSGDTWFVWCHWVSDSETRDGSFSARGAVRAAVRTNTVDRCHMGASMAPLRCRPFSKTGAGGRGPHGQALGARALAGVQRPGTDVSVGWRPGLGRVTRSRELQRAVEAALFATPIDRDQIGERLETRDRDTSRKQKRESVLSLGRRHFPGLVPDVLTQTRTAYLSLSQSPRTLSLSLSLSRA